MTHDRDSSQKSNRRFWTIGIVLLSLNAVFLIVIFLALRSQANNNVEPFVYTVPTPSSHTMTETLNVVTTQLDQLTEEHNKLVRQTSSLEMTVAQFLEFLSTVAQHVAWPLLLVLTLYWFNPQIGKFLANVAERSKTDTFEIGNVKFTSNELLTVISEREQLRLGLKVAGADGKLDKAELREIVSQAELLLRGKSELDRDAQWKILRGVIRVALADETMDDEEYKAILKEAQEEFNMNNEDVTLLKHEIIRIRNFMGRRIKLPSELEGLAQSIL